MTTISENGKLVRPYEPAPGCSLLFAGVTSTTAAPISVTDGYLLDPHDCSIGIEVDISSGGGTSIKGVKLWLLSRAALAWHDPTEGIVLDLHNRPGDRVFYVLADAWLYERVYIQILQNDGAGTINANLISR